MHQDQEASSSDQVSVITPPTLETIPEDLAEIIAAKIKDWAKVEGDLEQREKARKMRDSALRAVAFTCRKSHQVFQPALLENVTLDFGHFFPFCQALLGNQGYGDSIKSLTFSQIETIHDEQQAMMHSSLVSLMEAGIVSVDLIDPILDPVFQCKAFAFRRLVSIQSLVILHSLLTPRSLKDLSCFPNSLKRLFIPFFNPPSSEKDQNPPLNAKNVIWLLSFGALQESCLGCTISTSDFDFLSEHHQAFEKTSNIKKLSLCFRFVYKESDRRTRWETSRARYVELKSGDMKTEAVRLLLSSVNRLECLELLPAAGGESESDDEAIFNLNHLFFNLEESLGSIRHLRLIGFSWFVPSGARIAFPPYLYLKTLSLERGFLLLLTEQITLKLPSSLERLVLMFYLPSSDGSFDFIEEHHLAQVVKSQVLPNLKKVLVPSAAIDSDGKIHSAEDTKEWKIWADRREKLESEPVFKSGKVQLRKVGPGLKITSNDETFMSSLDWLSPP